MKKILRHAFFSAVMATFSLGVYTAVSDNDKYYFGLLGFDLVYIEYGFLLLALILTTYLPYILARLDDDSAHRAPLAPLFSLLFIVPLYILAVIVMDLLGLLTP